MAWRCAGWMSTSGGTGRKAAYTGYYHTHSAGTVVRLDGYQCWCSLRVSQAGMSTMESRVVSAGCVWVRSIWSAYMPVRTWIVCAPTDVCLS